jgi:hypothetical protein
MNIIIHDYNNSECMSSCFNLDYFESRGIRPASLKMHFLLHYLFILAVHSLQFPFSWNTNSASVTNCGVETDVFEFQSLDLLPDPVTIDI